MPLGVKVQYPTAGCWRRERVERGAGMDIWNLSEEDIFIGDNENIRQVVSRYQFVNLSNENVKNTTIF